MAGACCGRQNSHSPKQKILYKLVYRSIIHKVQLNYQNDYLIFVLYYMPFWFTTIFYAQLFQVDFFENF